MIDSINASIAPFLVLFLIYIIDDTSIIEEDIIKSAISPTKNVPLKGSTTMVLMMIIINPSTGPSKNPPSKIGKLEKFTFKNDGKIGRLNFKVRYKMIDIVEKIAIVVICLIKSFLFLVFDLL